ncbi:Facilitated trehalose transporter Tret1, partial [Pseudolycoriella hygida]
TILSLCVSMAYFCIGLVRGYSAPAVPSMETLNPELLPNKFIASWTSSIPPLGACIGSIVAGPLMHYIGRKYTILCAGPTWVVSWLIIANAPNWHYLMIGRGLSGFCVGLSLPSAQIYVTECTDPKIRGVIGSFPSISMSSGVLMAYIFGTFFAWDHLAWTCCGVAVGLTMIMIAMPRSPVWLRSKNRNSEAERSIKWLGLESQAKNVEMSLHVIEKGPEKQSITATKVSSDDNPHSWKTLMSRPILMPLAIGLTLLAIQQLSGIDSIIFFTVEIFRASGSSIDGNLATIIVGTVQLISNIASLFFVDKSGRKPLLIASGIVMCLSNASMGVAFYLNEHGYTSFGYLPLVSLIVFMMGFSIGFGCIPFLLMGEIFPTAQRSLLSSIAGSTNLGMMFLVIKSFHPLEQVITTAGTFWIYSILCFLGVLFVIFFVPETKGADLDSIGKLFLKKSDDNLKTDSKGGDVDKNKQNGQEKCDNSTHNAIIKQTILSLCISVSYFCIGLVRGYSAPAVPSIKEINPDLLPTKDIASWISSIPPCFAFIGSLVAGPLMHFIGRKYTILIAAPIWVVAWITIGYAANWYQILAGRMLSGLCVGLVLPSAQIYVTECTDPKIRGVIGSFPSISMSGGILTAYIFGTFITWYNLAWMSCGVAVSLILLMITMPRSPVWLQSKNFNIEAEKSTKWLGLKPQMKRIDLQNEKVCAPSNQKNENPAKVLQEDNPHSLKTLMSRPILMPLAIGLTLLAIQQLSGIDSIIFFTVEIFRASGSSIDGHLATIIVGTVQLVSNIASLFFVDKSGRKPLLIASGIVMCLSNASMGVAFYLNEHGYTSFGYLPLVSLIVFMMGFSIGFGCIPFLLMGEIFPTAQRSFLSSIAGSMNLGIMFVVIKTYHPLEEAISTAGTFWIYSILCFLGALFVIFFVPETKGRDLDSISKLFLKEGDDGLNKTKENCQQNCDTRIEMTKL